jgi:hypothetical protein
MHRILLLFLIPGVLAAQTPQGPQTTEQATATQRDELPPLPALGAVRATSPIRVDGRLDEPDWERATPATDFRQHDPQQGELATQRTEVRVLYDDHSLYIGARMFDTDPSLIRARLARRDEGVSGSDLLEIYIDSYHDRVSGYLFRITPAGAIRDGTVNATGFVDASWDGVWESAASIDSLGWIAEARIPFSQLRYAPREGGQTFGINFRRSVGRLAESSEYAYTPRRVTGGPHRWATLTGLANLPRSRYLELMPYGTTRAEFTDVPAGHPFRSGNDYRVKGGLDLRYGLTSGLTLSGTVNPDFGQVEVDPARVNLTANELFFPERRPFFVEGAEIFRYGQLRGFNRANFPTLFHSRRIGRSPQRRIDFQHPFADMPEEATIAAAAKIAGQPRPGLSVGILDAFTLRESARFENAAGERGSAEVEPQTNYFVSRVRQDFRGGSTQIGSLVTAVNRNLGDDALADLLRRDAYFVGLDFAQSWRQRMWGLDGSIGRSVVRGSPAAITSTQRSAVRYFQRPDAENYRLDPERTSLYGNATSLAFSKMSGRNVIGSLTWQSVSPGFEANDVGFQSQAGYRALSQGGGFRRDQPGRVFRNWFVGPFSSRRWNYDGDVIHSNLGISGDGRLLNFWGGWWNIGWDAGVVDDRLTRGGPVTLRPPSRWGGGGIFSDQRRIWTVDMGFWNNNRSESGWDQEIWSQFAIRPNPALRVSLSPSLFLQRNRAQFLRSVADTTADATFERSYVFGDLRYSQLSAETRVDWTFTPRLSLQVFAQPLVASGKYGRFSTLRAARTFDLADFTEADGTLMDDPDAGWIAQRPGGPRIVLGRPDFTTLSLVGNAVMRWEYRPGSALFFVWQQRRSGFDERGRFVPGRDIGAIFQEKPENVFAIKASYWIGR